MTFTQPLLYRLSESDVKAGRPCWLNVQPRQNNRGRAGGRPARVIKTHMNPILETAGEIVDGPRQQDYGHPLDNFGCIGDLWSTFMRKRFKIDVKFEPEDVALMMILTKVDREAERHTDDNLVDICGYAACIDKIRNERTRRSVILRDA